MRAVLLAGAPRTRLGEKTAVRPRSVAELGGKPIASDIVRYGIDAAVICPGCAGDAAAQPREAAGLLPDGVQARGQRGWRPPAFGQINDYRAQRAAGEC